MEMIYRLEDKANRPIIKLDQLFPGCTALLDTGAIIPVWTKDVKLLQSLGAHFYKQNVEFAGFGGKTKGDLYKITLYLDKIIFPDLPIIVHNNDNIPGYFIFSATMFKNMIYTIDDITKQFIVVYPDNQVCQHIKIIDSNGKISVLVNQ